MEKFNKALFKPKEKILVGVSGGLDSIVLLHYLVKKCTALKLQLTVIHFNHLLRGKNAYRDADFVSDLAKKYKLPFMLGVRDVKKYAEENKLSIEDAARTLRYRYFQQAAQESGATKIALAHNQDDQIETIVMRFLRGSAAKGLAGIAESRMAGTLEIIRPLLKVSRKDIKKYAVKNNLKNIEDETNKDTVYLRNKVRRELIPVLKKYNPNLEEALVRQADIFLEEEAYLQQKTAEAYRETLLEEAPDYIRLDNRSIKHYPPAIQRRIVRLAIEKLCGYLSTISLLYIDNFLVNELTTIKKDSKGKLLISK